MSEIIDPCWYHRLKHVSDWFKSEFPWKSKKYDGIGVDIISNEFDFKLTIEILIKKLIDYGLLP